MIPVLVALLVLWAAPAWAACSGASPTWTAVSLAESEVQDCITKANSAGGDTVILPAGDTQSTPWTVKLLTGKPVTIQGQGVGVTIIRDSVTNRAGSVALIQLSSGTIDWANPTNPAKCVRLTGVSILPDPGVTSTNNAGMIQTSGCFRLDHFATQDLHGVHIKSFNAVGVIDHGTMSTTIHGPMVFVFHGAWKGVGSSGDNSWAQPTQAGTQYALYFEDMYFVHPNEADAAIDGQTAGDGGGRYVVRYSEFDNGSSLSNHPTGHDTRARGNRHIEAYGNNFHYTPGGAFNAIFMVSGTVLAAINQITGYTQAVSMDNWRRSDAAANWGTSSGHSAWDVNNAPTQTGTDNGSAACPTGTAFKMTDTTQTFTGLTPGYLYNVTRSWGSYIASFTGTTVTAQNCSHFDCTSSYKWCPGDSYEIRTPGPYPVLDQLGRGSGNLVSGSTPTATLPLNQAAEPVYLVANTYTSVGQITNNGDASTEQANRDFYVENAGCVAGGACASGTGSGTTLPTTCTPRVGFWKTNEGNWDTTKAANASGKMYVCTATDTWSPLWGDNATGEPYTYPHPLITTGGSGGPGAGRFRVRF